MLQTVHKKRERYMTKRNGIEECVGRGEWALEGKSSYGILEGFGGRP